MLTGLLKDICFRWQLTRGLRDEAAKTIHEIATVNKKPIPHDLEKRLGIIFLLVFLFVCLWMRFPCAFTVPKGNEIAMV